jgi:hypothetical protein
VKRILLTGAILTLLLSSCADTDSHPDQQSPQFVVPKVDVGDECSYMYRASDTHDLALCRAAEHGQCNTLSDKVERDSLCPTMARNMAQSAAEMRAEELSPANQRLQALEEKIDEQQLEIDETNRRARDAESASDAAVGMMLSR